MIVSDNGGGSFEQAPTGAHVARCTKLIDLGTHHDTYEGKPLVRRQVMIGFELPTELIQSGDFAGKPFTVSAFYTLSLHEKSKLRPMLESWRGRPFSDDELKGFDLHNVLGKPCMVQVGRNKKDRAEILSVMSLPKGMTAPAQVNDSTYFTLDAVDETVFESLSKGLKAKVQESDEWKKYVNGGPAEASDADPEDIIPF